MTHLGTGRFLRQRAVLLLLLLGALPTSATPRSAEGIIRFYATSTLHDFSGEVHTGPFLIDVVESTQEPLTVIGATFSLPVKGMTTHEAKRDKNMYELLKAELFACVAGAASNVVVKTDGTATVPLTLTLAGQTHVLEATLSGWGDEGGVLSGKLAFSISLKTFGLKPPSLLWFIRVGDSVRVECELTPPTTTAAVSQKAE